MDLSAIAEGVRARLEVDKEYFTEQEYAEMRRDLKSVQKKTLEDGKKLLSSVQERLDARKRRALGDLPLPPSMTRDVKITAKQAKLLGSIVVDDRLLQELHL